MIRALLVCLLTLAPCCKAGWGLPERIPTDGQTKPEHNFFKDLMLKHRCAPVWKCVVPDKPSPPKDEKRDCPKLAEFTTDKYLDSLCSTKLPALQQCAQNSSAPADCIKSNPVLAFSESICRNAEGLKAARQCWLSAQDNQQVKECFQPFASLRKEKEPCRAVQRLNTCLDEKLRPIAECRDEDRQVASKILSSVIDRVCSNPPPSDKNE